MDQIASLITSVTARIVTRWIVALFVGLGLGTAAAGESLVGAPEVQALLVTLIGGLAAWIVERATVLARRTGGKT